MNIPRPVGPGQGISAKMFNDLLDCVKALTPKGGPGIRVNTTAAGTTISFGGAIPKAGSPLTIDHPFKIVQTSDTTVDITHGTLNDLVPSPLTLTISTNGTRVIYLDATLNLAGAITSVAVTSGASQPADSDTHAYITIGSVVVASSIITTVNQAATHSLRFNACDRVVNEDGVTLDNRGTYEFWGF
jgi:hypothetical protein